MNKDLHGVGVAIVTPFTADKIIDFDALKKLIQHLSEGGVDYLVVQGTTGESVTTTHEEKKEILTFIKKNNYKNLPIVYGIGGNNTLEVVKTIKETDLTQVRAVLSVCPYYNKPSPKGVIQHYTQIADASPVPIIMYNIPGRTGINMSSETTLILAKHPNIIGIKEASCAIEQCMEIYKKKPKDFLLISGDDVQAVPIISIGGVGVMSVVANAFPKQFSQMIHWALEGKFHKSRTLLGKFLAIDSLLYEEGNPVGIKKFLHFLGLIEPHVRLPLEVASVALGKKIEKMVKKEGLV